MANLMEKVSALIKTVEHTRHKTRQLVPLTDPLFDSSLAAAFLPDEDKEVERESSESNSSQEDGQ